MTHIQLLAQLDDLGVRLQVKDNNLKISAPKGSLAPNLVNELKDKKDEGGFNYETTYPFTR